MNAVNIDFPMASSLPYCSSTGEKSCRASGPPSELGRKTQHDVFAEAIRVLLASVQMPKGQHSVRSVAVTSALPGEGKTTASACLARVAAQGGQRVLLIDCDLRRRSLGKLFEIEPDVDLLEVLDDLEKFEATLWQKPRAGVFVLALKGRVSPEKLVIDPELVRRGVLALATKFDLIVLDTPPVLASAGTAGLAHEVDAVIFLARPQTPIELVSKSVGFLEEAGGQVAKVVSVQF